MRRCASAPGRASRRSTRSTPPPPRARPAPGQWRQPGRGPARWRSSVSSGRNAQTLAHLFFEDAPDAVVDGPRLRGIEHAGIARASERHGDLLTDARRPAAHYGDAVAQEDGLVDV